jgi:hypothetical protein
MCPDRNNNIPLTQNPLLLTGFGLNDMAASFRALFRLLSSWLPGLAGHSYKKNIMHITDSFVIGMRQGVENGE